ncbi:protein Niban [Arapaima gigas]
MGVSSSSLLDESKSSHIRDRADAELQNFSPYYRHQYSVAFFSQLHDEVEQHSLNQTQLLKQRELPEIAGILYGKNMLHFDDTRKWKERFVVVRADYSLECHNSYESFTKGLPPRESLLPTGGIVLTSEEKYMAVVDRCIPGSNSAKEKSVSPVVVMPGQFPVYLSLPYHRDSYFCFHSEEQRSSFISVLTDCIRHVNHDFLKKATHEVQAFLKAVQFYREQKGHYESWDKLIGSDVSVLANLVMEELLPSLETDLLPRMKGKEADRRRAWFATVEAAYLLVQEQLLKGFAALKEECQGVAKEQETLIRSHMDQIVSSWDFLEGKLKAVVMEPAMQYCSEKIQPFLASILEELMGPLSSGFREVRLLLENQMDQLCVDFQGEFSTEELKQALEQLEKANLQECYQHLDSLQEPLLELHDHFKFTRGDCLVHCAQLDMQQLMQNAVYTFELLLNTALKDHQAEPGLAMEKAKCRVLKQYDYDSSTVRKRIFQDALVEITLSAVKENLAATCKPVLQTFEQYIFADYADFIQVENVYEDILLQILEGEINKVVKEAASLKKHNLFMDSVELHFVSQSSLGDSGTSPKSSPATSSKTTISNTQQIDPPPLGNGLPETHWKKQFPATTKDSKMDTAEILSSTELLTDLQTLNETEGLEVDKTAGLAQTGKMKVEDKLSCTTFDKPETHVQTSSPVAEKDPLGDSQQPVTKVLNEKPGTFQTKIRKLDEKQSSGQTDDEELSEMSCILLAEETVTVNSSSSNQPEVDRDDSKAKEDKFVRASVAPETQMAGPADLKKDSVRLTCSDIATDSTVEDSAPSPGQQDVPDKVQLDSFLCSDSNIEAQETTIHLAEEDNTVPCDVFKEHKEPVAVHCILPADGSTAGPTVEVNKSNTVLISDLAADLEASRTAAQGSSCSEVTESQVCQQIESLVEPESTEEFTQSLQPITTMEECSPSPHMHIPAKEPEKVLILDCVKEVQDVPVKVIEEEDLMQQYPGESNA